MAIPIHIADLSFNTGGISPRWMLDITAGWDQPDLDSDPLATLVEGSADGRIMPRHRTIVCDGVMSARTEADHWDAYYRLSSLVPIRDEVVFQVDEPGTPKLAYVKATAGNPRIRTHNGLMFEFSLTLRANDPRKYAATPTVVPIPAGGSATFTSAGRTSSPVTVTATSAGTVDVGGSVAGHRLVADSVPAGSVLDSRARTIRTSAGLDLFTALAPGFEWLVVVPGEQTITNDGTADLSLSFSDAWL